MSITPKSHNSNEEKVDLIHKAYAEFNDQNSNTVPSLAEVVRNACAQIKEKKVPSKIEVPSDDEILKALQGALDGVNKQEVQGLDLKQIKAQQWEKILEKKAYSSNPLDSFVAAKKEKWEKDRKSLGTFLNILTTHENKTNSNPSDLTQMVNKYADDKEGVKVSRDETGKLRWHVDGKEVKNKSESPRNSQFSMEHAMLVKYIHRNEQGESLLPKEIIDVIARKGECLNLKNKLDAIDRVVFGDAELPKGWTVFQLMMVRCSILKVITKLDS